ncbi:hypothetical protein [Streptomyces sp. NPDC040750]|uniref:hypothetical protein n=1 Tax=Streptomyces sp. NPDC040750 TaxID=3154491 RepID=UPI0033DE6676
MTLVPLDGGRGGEGGGPASATAGPGTDGGRARTSGAAAGGANRSTGGATDIPRAHTPGPDTAPPAGTAHPPGGQDGDGPGRTEPTPASSTPAPGRTTTAPASPAALSWGAPATEGTDRRWCQKVTVGFRNSGGTEVRSGSVTFGTHIIGGLGIDWGMVASNEDLPVPIGARTRADHTWTVCVDAWRVPLGMHIETRDVSVRWE